MTETTEESQPDHLYVIGEGNGSGIVKIGRSFKPAARLGEIQTGNPAPMKILLVVPKGGCHEGDLHGAFRKYRLGGEWFDFKDRDPVTAVQAALAEIARYEATVPRASRREERPAYVECELRRNVCQEASCATHDMQYVLDAAIGWFLNNHPDPAAYLISQGYAWHCVEESLHAHLPPASRERMLSEYDPLKGEGLIA